MTSENESWVHLRADRLGPATALSHPGFLMALAVLAVNDHFLKAGALWPALSGKLSDLAGLFVAPLVLAWLARVSTMRGWFAVHLAVGAGFGALQHPVIAQAVEALTPWRVWADPTDLWALPMLGLSFVVLGQAQRRPQPPRRKRSHFTSTGLGLVALVLCAGSGGPGQESPPRYPFPPAGVLETDVFIRNHLSADLPIGVRRIREERTVDCDELLQAPETVVTGGDLVDEQEWTVAARDAVPLWDRRGGAQDRECYAVVLRVRGKRWLIAWRHGTPELREIPIRLEPHQSPETGAMRISTDPDTPPFVPPAVTVRVWEQ